VAPLAQRRDHEQRHDRDQDADRHGLGSQPGQHRDGEQGQPEAEDPLDQRTQRDGEAADEQGERVGPVPPSQATPTR
jgi:hypothetical protein